MADLCPQSTELLAALRHGPMTSLQILQELGIYRAGARVFDLRGAGYNVATDLITVPTRRGRTARVARYSLLPTNGPQPDIWNQPNSTTLGQRRGVTA